MKKEKNPLKMLKELRKDIVIKQSDIEKMIKKSKKEWSKIK
ncbi:MAG TPA: hypothetical protein VJB11_00820 [archaeon]|nr:hypothetical protein [archaeon]